MTDPSYSDFHGIQALNAVDALSIAAGASKFEAMQLLLDGGVDINAVADYSKMTALCSAARLGATRSVTFLIEHGADVNRPAASGSTPLMYACSGGKKKGLLVAQQLIAAGANVNYAISGEVTALDSAIEFLNLEIAQLLIDKGAFVDGPPGTSQTPLMLAARTGDVAMVKLIIDNGADRTRTCSLPWAQNRTARGLAELEKRHKVVKYFKSLDGDA
jgi:ankyrin repeat protein